MILLIAIILFIIFLIYSIKSRSEEYTLEGLKLSWKNKASIEGVVDKWIVILKDKSGTKIHEYENSDAGNLKDFTDVTMNIVDKKEFDNRIIGNNTLELYYNKVSSDTKLYTKTVTFTEEDFGVTIDTSKLEEIDIPKPEPEPEPEPGYTYDFILNTDISLLNVDDGKTIYIEYIEIDGVLIKKEQIITHIIPAGGADKMTSKTSGPASWELDKIKIGDKIFSIISDKKIDKIDITYTKRKTTPGWIVNENDENKIHENKNRHVFGEQEEGFKSFTYDIKNSKSTIYDVPYQILLSGFSGSKYKDDWCKQGPAVHQDVPGCGRICSNNTHAWRKDKDYGKKKSWSEYPGSVDCPAAKLDEVWQKKPGTNSRYLRTGEYSSSCNLM